MKKSILFILASALAVITVCGSKQAAKEEQTAVKKEIGVQLYNYRELIGNPELYAKNHEEVFKELAAEGYTAAEAACYQDEGTLYGVAPEQYKADLEAAGLKSLSTHIGHSLSEKELKSGDFTEALKWWDTAIAAHKKAGCKYIVTPGFPVPDNLKDLKTYCDYFNAIGKKCAENGIQYGYHNHSHEFRKVEDQVIYDFMLQNTDPQYVFFEMDIYWACMGNAYPIEYFKKYPGRFKMLHVKDHLELGQSGMVDFRDIFENADVAGLQDYVVEMEAFTNNDWKAGSKASADFLLNAPYVKESYSK